MIFASALPSAYGVMRSSVPWITSTGQRTRSASSVWSRRVTGVAILPSSVSPRVAPSVSCDHATASSICLVECGSVSMLSAHHCTKSA